VRFVLALLLLVAACGSDDAGPLPDLAIVPVDLTASPDLNLGVCDCLQQLCAKPCSQYIPGMFPTLGCDECLHNGQRSPDMGCVVTPGSAAQCGVCYGVPGCFAPRF